MKNADMPANVIDVNGSFYRKDEDGEILCFSGLTKREGAAIAAMQGAWWNLTDRGRRQDIEHAAEVCVMMADALFKELDK